MLKPVTLLLLISVATSVVAEEDSTESFTQPVNDGRHLVQLGYTSVEGFDGDLTVVAANYTYSYSRHLRFSGTTQLAHLEAPETGASNDAGEKDDTGLGDSVLILQYDGWQRSSQYVTVRDGTRITIDYFLYRHGLR